MDGKAAERDVRTFAAMSLLQTGLINSHCPGGQSPRRLSATNNISHRAICFQTQRTEDQSAGETHAPPVPRQCRLWREASAHCSPPHSILVNVEEEAQDTPKAEPWRGDARCRDRIGRIGRRPRNAFAPRGDSPIVTMLAALSLEGAA